MNLELIARIYLTIHVILSLAGVINVLLFWNEIEADLVENDDQFNAMGQVPEYLKMLTLLLIVFFSPAILLYSIFRKIKK